MELQLKNIGMIKEANVKLDGLTVIAGENDTGKSTVGKALYSILKE
ncbi:MAG TPA: ABC transporter ATP-binding protein, partial [Sulfurovum sp.]|nr:ABC transporter ATP-binding protein [Sulfurovum sp.]